jgi:hypothetical protein
MTSCAGQAQLGRSTSSVLLGYILWLCQLELGWGYKMTCHPPGPLSKWWLIIQQALSYWLLEGCDKRTSPSRQLSQQCVSQESQHKHGGAGGVGERVGS